MGSWNSEGEPRYWRDTKVGQRLLRIGDKLGETHIIGSVYKKIREIWSRTDSPGVTAVWLAGGEKRTKKRQ